MLYISQWPRYCKTNESFSPNSESYRGSNDVSVPGSTAWDFGVSRGDTVAATDLHLGKVILNAPIEFAYVFTMVLYFFQNHQLLR